MTCHLNYNQISDINEKREIRFKIADQQKTNIMYINIPTEE